MYSTTGGCGLDRRSVLFSPIDRNNDMESVCPLFGVAQDQKLRRFLRFWGAYEGRLDPSRDKK